MAKYRDKIENERVAGNPIGEAVLKRLLQDGVLVLKDPLYFIQNDQVDKFPRNLLAGIAQGCHVGKAIAISPIHSRLAMTPGTAHNLFYGSQSC